MTLISKKKVLCALCLCAAAMPIIASADDDVKPKESGFEFGFGGGGSQLLMSPRIDGATTLGGGTYTVFAGYRFNQWAAAEASYLDTGQVSSGIVGTGADADTYYSFRTEPHIFTATGMGMVPITDSFSLFGRAGIAHIWYTANFTTTDLAVTGYPSQTTSFKETSNSLIWGGGMAYYFDRARLRLEYDQTKTNPDFDGVTADCKLRILTLTVAWVL
jgi:hypothetical protein